MTKINYIHTAERHHPKDALEILPYVFQLINPKSLLDVGCANGSWLNAAEDLGVKDIFGVDGISVDASMKLLDDSKFLQHDLRTPLDLGRTFDMVMSLEVAEHLPETAANTLVATLVHHSEVVLFSAAIPGQGGQYHINEQWPEYWHEKFKAYGYEAYDILRERFWNNPKMFWWYKQNVMFFVKKGSGKLEEFSPTNTIHGLVHPELFRKKIFRPKYYDKKQLWVFSKMFLKEYLKALKK
ncbi:class I SAM-dependent methyltransferase [Mangrovimonas sp. AS39]|uniref:class I SAM-dependent methyltransferase n=1 Tax=Mangrovimonas futianensis TaxID=2895523 RepID=UPI001E3B64DE|nr:class I SAM-dependent methyltransferase [Mangrovimonas futianensis]MCF1191234.1 class I SAM-dependent methyltransferase [Mangrovimonas futianensis]MCF1194929.1 class I SAM-dependent methyltransferase [Mangrovimonas futianensis]